MCPIEMHFTLQWISFSMVIPICMQSMHHLLGTRVSSIMRNTVNYEVVPGNCSSTFTPPTQEFKRCRCCAGCWSWSTSKSDVGSQSCQGPGLSVQAAETKSQHRFETEEWMAPCELQNSQILNFHSLNTVLSKQFLKEYLLFSLCRNRLKYDRHSVRK